MPPPVASPASLGASPAKAVVEARSPGRGQQSGEGTLVRRISFGAPPTQPGESSLVRRLSLPFTGGSSSSASEDSSILARLSSSFEAARHDAIDESGIDVGFLLL